MEDEQKLDVSPQGRLGPMVTGCNASLAASKLQEVRRILADVRQQYDQVHLESERREAPG